MSPAQDVELHRDFGRMQAKIESLEGQVATMQRQLADVHAVVMKAQGSWKALVGTAGFSAAVTGFVIKGLAMIGVLK